MSQSFTSNQIYTQPAINGGRLSLQTAVPVTSSDVTGAGTLYWVPYKSSYIALYNGVRWLAINAGEKSLALTLTSGSVYDVFGYLNSSGTLQLETLVWSSTTARATNLTQQDGCYVKSGDATRRYLGTIYASGTNTTEDSAAIRGVWNIDNQVLRSLSCKDSTDSWTLNGTYRPFNNNTTYGTGRVGVVIGLTSLVYVKVYGMVTYTTAATEAGPNIGVNSTTTAVTDFRASIDTTGGNGYFSAQTASYTGYLAVGFSYISTLEQSNGILSTFYGDANSPTTTQSGLHGFVTQ